MRLTTMPRSNLPFNGLHLPNPCKLHGLLLIYRPRKDGRLSWPSWLTHSGRLTHEVVTRQPWIRRRSGKVRQLQGKFWLHGCKNCRICFLCRLLLVRMFLCTVLLMLLTNQFLTMQFNQCVVIGGRHKHSFLAGCFCLDACDMRMVYPY